MPAIKYRVRLTEEEKEELESLLRKGKSAARKQTRARILLKAAAGSKDAEIMERWVYRQRGSTTPGKNVSRKASKRRWRIVLVRGRPRSLMTSNVPRGSPWRVRQRPPGTSIGPCASWPDGSYNWALRSRSATRAFVSF